MRELVSIVTPNYNGERFIAETIESVLAQSYENWEMIIVDDASSDGSRKLIGNYLESDSRIRLIKLPRSSGAAVARNTAIEAARGRYIAFLDSDDLWKPEKLEKQIGFMQENEVAFSYSSYDLIDEEGVRGGSFVVPEKVDYRDLLKTCSIGCLTAIYDAEHLGKVLMPLIEKRQDYGLWLKLLKQIDYAYGYPEPLAIYRIRNHSLSRNKFYAAQYQWKVYRDVEKLGMAQAVFYFLNYAVNGFRKYR